MKIAIPSYKRSQTKLVSLQNIPKNWHEQTTVYVRKEELSLYRAVVPSSMKLVGLQGVTDIKTTRNAIHDLNDGNIVMMDDDLSFRKYENGKYVKADEASIDLMFKTIEEHLNYGFAHCGICFPNVGIQAKGKPLFNTRYSGLLGLNLRVAKLLGVKYRTTVMEDFDYALRLIKLGYPSIVFSKWIMETKLNTEGGCSEFRTQRVQNRGARTLEHLHKPFVKAVKAHSWGDMDNRYDVRVSWKKAFQSAPVKHIPKGFEL